MDAKSARARQVVAVAATSAAADGQTSNAKEDESDEEVAGVVPSPLHVQEHPEEKTEPAWEDAYARHFGLVLTTILHEREDFRDLFSDEELAIAAAFLTKLSPFEKQLYARLFQRRGPWFKTTSLFRYFLKANAFGKHAAATTDIAEGGMDNQETPDAGGCEEEKKAQQLPDHTLVQATIDSLVQAGLLLKFPCTTSDSRVSATTKDQDERVQLDAAMDAIQQCATTAELAALHKKMTGSNGSGGKADLLQATKRVVKTQRRIDGSRIPVARLMHQIWTRSYPLAGKGTSDVMVVQMAEAARDLLLRMHRLFYFMASSPYNSSSIPPQLTDMSQLLQLAMRKLPSQEPTQWPGLMVFFGKVAYPEYKLTSTPSSDATDIQSCARHRTFPSSEAYVCYEVAYQLHGLMSTIKQCLVITTPDKEYQEPDLELKWILNDTPPAFFAFQRLLFILYEETEDDDDCVLEVGPPARQHGVEGGVLEAASWQMRSWEQFHRELGRMQSLDDLVVASKICLHAYLRWVKASTLDEGKTGVIESGVPVFFSKCNAGYHLARVVHIAVGLYEKLRKYQLACLLLNELLATPLLERKRGYWWDRLALNLEHLKCVEQARVTCLNALEDPLVFATDRIALERRLQRLQRQKNLQEGVNENERSELVSADEQVTQSTYEHRHNYIVGRPLNRQTGEKSRFIGYDDEPCNVEQLVLQYYRDHSGEGEGATGGWYGVHSEGVVLRNIFGVLMWEILYADVPNVFQTPFQSAPLDFGYADVFCKARKALIEHRLAQVRQQWTMEELLTKFAATWKREYGKVTRFVHWPSDEAASLQFHLLTVVAMRRTELADLLHYMATSKEFHQAQNGLPDLLLLKFEPSHASGDAVLQPPGCCLDDHDCLNVHAFCGMEEDLNLNVKPSPTSVPDQMSIGDGGQGLLTKENGAPEHPLERVLSLLGQERKMAAHLKLVEVKGPRDRLSDKQLLW
ncbi:hypothetical protein BBJ28_00019105, partial [Nothophytophthora sp. Chile5]